MGGDMEFDPALCDTATIIFIHSLPRCGRAPDGRADAVGADELGGGGGLGRGLHFGRGACALYSLYSFAAGALW